MIDKTMNSQPHRAAGLSDMPLAVVSRRAADRIRAGHLWVYRTDIERLSDHVEAGALVNLVDARRLPLGTALYSAASQIAFRLVSPTASLTRADYLDSVQERLLAALCLRDRLTPASENNNACRLVFSEADGLPGIVVDRYAGLAIVQLLIQGTAQADVRKVVAETLSAQLDLQRAIERPDPRIRELEQLAPPPERPLFERTDDTGQATIFTINGLHFHFDPAGQKTGAFLDQRLNYAAAAFYAHGQALDLCTYQGGFALHMAAHCERVTGVDASRAALEVADRNLTLNPRLTASVDWIEADAFELLREFESSGCHYDTIVLDPPAFAKSKRATEGALRGYKELNLRALKMLRPGGHLVTCSCSHHIALQEFTAILASAAVDAGRTIQLLEIRGAAPDHPAILTLPETSYLKCLICQVR